MDESSLSIGRVKQLKLQFPILVNLILKLIGQFDKEDGLPFRIFECPLNIRQPHILIALLKISSIPKFIPCFVHLELTLCCCFFKYLNINPFTLRVSLESIVCYFHTFENNFGIKEKFSKYLKVSCCLTTG